MYSTRNLIVNGGFSRMPPDPRQGWDFGHSALTPLARSRISVLETNRDGLPRSPYAFNLEAQDDGRPTQISQTVTIGAVPTRRFVLRATACGTGVTSDVALIVAIVNGRDLGGSREICRRPLDLTLRWQRFRVEFELPEGESPVSVLVTVQGPSRRGAAVTITDMRLAGLLRPVEKIAVRFDTRGDMVRASSRLRAFLLEDYLDLIGCRTSLNGGWSFDLYVCQKIQPWSNLAIARAAGTPVVFDLDDNDLLLSALRAINVRWFACLADAVTIGSDFLRDMAAEWTSRTFLLENPVDVLDPEIVRGDQPWGGRLVWFGMPENRWMLRELHLDRPVTTITRGGDIEYSLGTVDRHLVAFDLALLPVALNDETRAKNANRMVKCVALGLPFLASDTPEHRHALAALGLPDEMLAPPDGDWNALIGEIGPRYADWRRAVVVARPRAYEVYGVERIAAGWLEFCAGLVAAKTTHNR